MKKLLLLLLFPISSFAQISDATLNLEADTIRLETAVGRNTAKRVGRMFKNLIASKLNFSTVITPGTRVLAAGGNTTSNTIEDIRITRTGTASTSVAQGSSIFLSNGTSTKGMLFQNSDDNFQLFSYNGSSWTEQARVTSLGILMNGNNFMGTISVPSPYTMGVISANQTSDASIFHLAALFQAEQMVATSNSIQGVEGYAKLSNPSGTVALAIGAVGNIELANTNTLTTGRSVQAGGNTSAAGTITEWDLFYGNMANTASATITTAIGLKIDNFPSGAATKWGVFIADNTANNYFAGKIKYGTSTTGGGSAALGANSPAVTNTAPYTWLTFISSDGSTIYVPGWK